MANYLIVNVNVKDPAAYEQYRLAVPAIIHRHGGEYLARGGEVRVMEGDWSPTRMVLLRFPDLAATTAFLNDPEYQPLKALRNSIAETQMVAVEGL